MTENKFNREKQQLKNPLQFQTEKLAIEETVSVSFITVRIYNRTSTAECSLELATSSQAFSVWLK